jgi:hypothetical protein
LGNGLALDSTAGRGRLGGRLVSRLETVLLVRDESAGSVWSVWLHVVYGLCLWDLQEWSLGGKANEPSLRKRSRFRTGISVLVHGFVG